MHELSIASAMADLVRRYVQPGEQVLCVHMQAGPLRGIDPDTMQLAWQATTGSTEFAGSVLELEILPWQLHCLQCDHQWPAASMNDVCSCGAREPSFTGGDELLLAAIDVDDMPPDVESGSGEKE